MPDPPVIPRSAERTLDIENWPRQQVFHLYKDAVNPQWGTTVRLNVTQLRKFCQAKGRSYLQGSVFVYALTCNQYEPMRYRIRQNMKKKNESDQQEEPEQTYEVICHERVHPSMTIMRSDETYGYLAFDASTTSFTEFRALAAQALDYFHHHTTGLNGTPRDDFTHGSVLPWIDFTSYEHAISRFTMPSVPKYVFGKLVHEPSSDTWSQAFCLHVHHGLMDGYHVGKFLQMFQDNLNQAEILLST